MTRLARCWLLGSLAANLFLGSGPGCHEKPQRLDPLRVYSIGDSISKGFDAWFVGENPAMAWATGTHGPVEIGLGLPYIFTHVQRIAITFGPQGVGVVDGAMTGASYFHGLEQAEAAPPDTTYVTVMLGGNDVCRGDGNEDGEFDVDDIPSVTTMRNWVGRTLDELEANLLPGATVMVVGIPDIKRFRDVALFEKGLLGIDCPLIWETTALGFPCGTLLSPLTTEASRTAVQERNFAYNDVIEEETRLRNFTSERVYFHYASLEEVDLVGEHISSIDCFHPSHLGEALISHVAWESGPFAD